MNELTTIQLIAVAVLPVLFAITVHEAAHGWMAGRLGDATARMLGRVTLNPIRHIDPVGTLLVPLATILLTTQLMGSFFLFGWAKPVPVTWKNLRQPRRDMALVAVAGPGANLAMLFLWALALKLGSYLSGDLAWAGLPLVYMGYIGISINAILMVLNLLPILPLDGGRILASLLPPKLALGFSRSEPYGLFIVLGLLVTGLLGKLIWPAVEGLQTLAAGLVGL